MLSPSVPTEATVSTEPAFRTGVQGLFSLAKHMEDNHPDPRDYQAYEDHMGVVNNTYSAACALPTKDKGDVLMKLQYVADRVREYRLDEQSEALEHIMRDVSKL